MSMIVLGVIVGIVIGGIIGSAIFGPIGGAVGTLLGILIGGGFGHLLKISAEDKAAKEKEQQAENKA